MSTATLSSSSSPSSSLTNEASEWKVSPPDTTEKGQLRQWLNKNLRVEMSDGRILVGIFLCTDRDANIILGSCREFLSNSAEEARILGLVMVPGRHIVSIHLDSTVVQVF